MPSARQVVAFRPSGPEQAMLDDLAVNLGWAKTQVLALALRDLYAKEKHKQKSGTSIVYAQSATEDSNRDDV